MIPNDIESPSPAYRMSERLRYQVARQLERIGELAPAIEQYRQCLLPPSRERIVRIYDQQGQHREALDLCTQIIEEPINDEEIQFANLFASRLIKRHGFDRTTCVESQHKRYQPEIIELELEHHDSVEIAVAEFYDLQDDADSCYYVENNLFNGVLGPGDLGGNVCTAARRFLQSVSVSSRRFLRARLLRQAQRLTDTNLGIDQQQ